MKSKYSRAALVLAVIAASLFLGREFLRSRVTGPVITAEVRVKLQPPAAVPAAGSPERSSVVVDKSETGRFVAADALAQSSFLPNSAVLGLDTQTCARLEAYLQNARTITYGLLVDSGEVNTLPDGRIRVVITGQSDTANELKDQVYASIESIVGKEAMQQLKENLGPKFDAKFAYFGAYDTTIDLAIDRTPNANEYVTMVSAYAQVRLFGLSKSNVRSTSVERKDRFERQFFPLPVPKPAAQGGGG